MKGMTMMTGFRKAMAGLLLVGAALPGIAGAQAVSKGYATNCQMCHQAGGKGMPGLFPRLTGRVDQIAQKPEGRKWLIAVLLYGQSGKISVDGKPVSGVMTPFARLKDEDIADTLTWLAQGKGKAFAAAEIAAVRAGPRMTAAQVGEERARLVKAGIVK